MNRKSTPRSLPVALAGLLGIALLAGSGTAFAHEHRPVGPTGQYTMTVGWFNEPAFADNANAVDIFLVRTADSKPVDTSKGDVVNLDVEVQYRAAEDEKAAIVDSAKLNGKPQLAVHTENRYNTWFKPTRPGAYAFRIKGTISDASNPKAGPVTVDETFICGKGSKGPHAFVCLTEPQIFSARTKQ